MFRDILECSMFLVLSTARSYIKKFSSTILEEQNWCTIQSKYVCDWRRTCHVPCRSKLTCSLWQTKLTNPLEYSLGKQQFELSTGTWSGRAPWRRIRRCFGSGPHRKALVTLVMNKACDFPYPIYDVTKNSIPYLWPRPLINTLFQTCLIIIFLV